MVACEDACLENDAMALGGTRLVTSSARRRSQMFSAWANVEAGSSLERLRIQCEAFGREPC